MVKVLYCIVSGDVLYCIVSYCFGRCFRPSSGAYHYNYSFWYCTFCGKDIVLFRAMYCIVLYRIFSGDVFAHHQTHITVITASGIVFFCGKDIVLCYMVSGDVLCCVVLYCIVSGDVFAHHQEHITVTTASGIIHRCCCWLALCNASRQQHRWIAVVTVLCS